MRGINTKAVENQRIREFKTWLTSQFKDDAFSLHALGGDASFRHYYRLSCQSKQYIAAEALVEQEDQTAFVKLSDLLHRKSLRVPRIVASDVKSGFVLQEDLGDDLLLGVLNHENMQATYQLALDELIKFQTQLSLLDYPFPVFDEKEYRFELTNFTHWFIQELLQVSLTSSESKTLEELYSLLIEHALTQPQVCAHRDYHSRNLFLLNGKQIAMIDYQDALMAPVTYDVVSLLRDCYITWPQEQVMMLLRYYYEAATANQLIDTDFDTFTKWFDWMGLQRLAKWGI